jgi:phosphatidylserine/phosphatidylglycerophosphate/cardiolipin synthase-like enzyme
VSVYFWPALPTAAGAAPQEKLEQILVKEIDGAKARISLLASYLTNAKVADALLTASRVRGVSVLILLDESQETDDDSQAVFLQNRGITVRADHRGAVDHNKVVLVDDEAITGSANLSGSGLTTSMENLLILREPTAVAAFGSYFEDLWKNAKTLPYAYHGKNPARRQ